MSILEITIRKPVSDEGFPFEHVRVQALGLPSAGNKPFTVDYHPASDIESLLLFYRFTGTDGVSELVEKLRKERTHRRELGSDEREHYDAMFRSQRDAGGV